MNLIEEIAARVAKGLKAAEVAAELKIAHGVEVGEDWVRKIMGADGFSAALSEAQQAVAAKVDAAGSEVAGALESFDESHEQDQTAGQPADVGGAELGAVEAAAKPAENTTIGEKTIELAKELGSGEATPGPAEEKEGE